MIVFSDMDGTFLTSAGEISPATWDMLDKLAALDHEFVPCTGRPLSGLRADLLAHPAVHYVVSSGGCSVVELSEGEASDYKRAKTIVSESLDSEIANRVWQFVADRDMTFEVFAEGEAYMPRRMYDRLGDFSGGSPKVEKALRDAHTPVDEEPQETMERVGQFERIIVYWRDEADGVATASELASIAGIDVVTSFPNNFEITKSGVSKGSALRQLCNHLGIPIDQSHGFGDSANDLGMIEDAGTSYAVANASPEIKDAADVVLEWDNNRDAVARAVEKLLSAS